MRRSRAPLVSAIALVACSLAESTHESEPLDLAALNDVRFEPERVEVCIDGLGKPRGSLVVRNVTERRFRLLFDAVNTHVSTTSSVFEPFASTSIELEPFLSEGSIVVLDDARTIRMGTVRFALVFDIRVLTVRAEGSDVFVTNPSSSVIWFAPHLEGPAMFALDDHRGGGTDDGPVPDQRPISATSTLRFSVRRTGDGPVRFFFEGPRCSQGALRELPVIDIP